MEQTATQRRLEQARKNAGLKCIKLLDQTAAALYQFQRAAFDCGDELRGDDSRKLLAESCQEYGNWLRIHFGIKDN
jgi:hypothetical protein